MFAMSLSPNHADVFFAIGDQTRRGLLERLAVEGEKTVTELVEPLTISQPAVSKTLAMSTRSWAGEKPDGGETASLLHGSRKSEGGARLGFHL